MPTADNNLIWLAKSYFNFYFKKSNKKLKGKKKNKSLLLSKGVCGAKKGDSALFTLLKEPLPKIEIIDKEIKSKNLKKKSKNLESNILDKKGKNLDKKRKGLAHVEKNKGLLLCSLSSSFFGQKKVGPEANVRSEGSGAPGPNFVGRTGEADPMDTAQKTKRKNKYMTIRKRSRSRALSVNKIFVGKGNVKHTSSKAVITLYLYNTEKKYLISNIKKQIFDLYRPKMPLQRSVNMDRRIHKEVISYNRPFSLKEFLRIPAHYIDYTTSFMLDFTENICQYFKLINKIVYLLN